MNILVPIKQVPESSNVKMDPATGTVIRAGVETVVNPLDLYAIEAALGLKEEHGGKVTVISMGPPQAMKALKEAVAMGCDSGALVSDRKLGGADTWATSYTLSRAAAKFGPFDLIVAGERATDGDTAQVGPGIAAWLDIPAATYVSKILGVDTRDNPAGRIRLERLVEEGYQILSIPMPCLITVVKEIARPRLPTLTGKIRSMEVSMPVLGAADLELNPGFTGLKGSPTRVVKIDTPRLTRSGRVVSALDAESLSRAADEIMELFREKGII
jgi:electron transfer flavoprotein beta subunit